MTPASTGDSGSSHVSLSNLEADNKKLLNTISSLQGNLKQMKGQAATQERQSKQQGGGKGRGQNQESFGEERGHGKRLWEPKNSDGGSRHAGGGGGGGGKGNGQKKRKGKGKQ